MPEQPKSWQCNNTKYCHSELDLDKNFASYNFAVAVVHQAIDTYNRIRPHMSCGNLTPEKAHQQQGLLTKKWKPKKYYKAKLSHTEITLQIHT